jgi:hypothetical protein
MTAITGSESAPTKKSTKASRETSGDSASSSLDAIKLLTTDHREVKELFQRYQSLVDHDAEDDEKQPIAHQICAMLTIHTTIEEEIFYPAAQDLIKEPELVDEANVEHASAKDLIAQLEASDPTDPLYDAKVKVLGEYIDHHVNEEESELFPQTRRAKLDMKALGERLVQRKSALMAEMGVLDEGEVL